MEDSDIQIAHRVSSRFSGTKAFSREDAFQACVEGFLKAGQPNDIGLKVRVMRDEMNRQSVETSYLMRVPWSTWKKMDQTPSHVRYTGLGTDYLVSGESPSTAVLDRDMGVLENRISFDQAWSNLQERHKDVIKWALTEWQKGKRPSGKRFYDFKNAVKEMREMMV
jgi:hypothetical protein